MSRALPVVNVTDVSESDGPSVSTWNTRSRATTRGVTGAASAAGTDGLRPPQPAMVAKALIESQVALYNCRQDIAEVTNR
jgi:hypothetical protein